MALVTVTVPLGAVEVGLYDEPANPQSTVVGAPPQWSDDSLDTYATAHTVDQATDLAFAPFDSVTGSAALVEGVELSALIAGHGKAGQAAAWLDNYPLVGNAWGGPNWDIPADTVPRWYTSVFGEDLIAGAAEILVAGGAATFSFAAPELVGVSGATCFEMRLSVTLRVAGPPRRIFPRDDGLMGGAPRVFPPSKGYQSGNRAAGGYV